MTNNIFQLAHTEALYNDLRQANTEQAKKERFLQYLSVAFAGDQEAQKLIAAIALGAERIITNITRGGRFAKGRADSQTDTIIIEWEKDLARTGEHAREQLEEYLEGNWRSGDEYRFVLVATDGITWRRYAPDWSRVPFGKFDLGRNFKLREINNFQLGPNTFGEFPFFLDDLLFASQPRQATLETIQADFGDTSSVFINSIACLQECAEDIKEKSELQVAFDQWRRFLSVAYGKFDDSPAMFLVHTYLAVFAKFIAYAVVTKQPIADDKTISKILDGSVFERLNIERFVEDDFFHWVGADGYFKRLKPMFREMSRQLINFDFNNVHEDILKGLYQELIDFETRHALGEYYTPDWLCERVVEELKIEEGSSFLDPACGSGSFLRAVIARMNREFPSLGAAELAEKVVGIDIHPLSVLISKTTVLLSLGTSIAKARRPVTLHVYLANSLLVPRGTADLFKESFQISVDNKDYVLDVKGLSGAEDFDSLVSFCDTIVHRYEEAQPIDRAIFTRLLKANVPGSFAKDLPSQLHDIYKGMKVAHNEGRDSIWKFILQNSYKPVFLMGRFDFVVGNPPWLTYAAITNSEYQSLLLKLSDAYKVTPKSKANMPHLEIAAIFLAHSINYFLKSGGKLAFVLPRSFISADQHDNTRSGVVEGVKLSKVWDLNGVSPLFRVPSCVMFAQKTASKKAKREIGSKGIAGIALSGRLPKFQVHWADVKDRLIQKDQRWYNSRLQGSRRGSRSALTTENLPSLVGVNSYAEHFTQGATIVPRNFFFVAVDQDLPPASVLGERVVNLHTSPSSDREAKKPWKGIILTGRAEGALLFRTAISRNVIPFSLVGAPLVVLPIKEADDGRSYKMLSAEDLLENGYTYGSDWFFRAEKHWNKNRTEKNKDRKTTLRGYLDWQGKLSEQNPKARWLVLYTSSAADASAVVVDRQEFDCPFVVDHKTYWCEFTSQEEAHFVAAFINSDYANDVIKDFQSRGLFGPRDIHKLILKVPFPKFDKKDKDHTDLSALGSKCSGMARKFVEGIADQDLQARALGKARSRLKEQLSSELNRIDAIVSKISGSQTAASQRRVNKRSRRSSKMGQLFD